MSSPMMPPPGGAPPGGPPPGGAPPGGAPSTMSPLNGPNAARMKKSGQVNMEGTFGEFMEGSFGIKWDDPVQVGMDKMKAAAQNATPQGQMKSAAASAGPPPGPGNQVPGISKPMPQGRPMAAQGGLGSLMGG